ncbi:metal-binding protein [Aphanothece hegewaldii CCALA 016]|uniref:Metal-binding protein n=1 Tax=Aphanothece hegewaldii CCALA 016 TaxID=2107694 RepID=A0A2T1LV89_9CHRO|nr:YceD family protein [Aphanothece hegewaldii]PSF35597.1 metal-binding protein [Aphanothece hegewaldii CCALA 016]
MDAIYIPHLLKATDHKRVILLDDFISELETLTPIRGKLAIRHGGTFLDVFVQAETIITLTCDRCLQQYNHRISLQTSEIIWLDDNADQDKYIPLEREVPMEDLSETLPSDGHFDPEIWLYEQLSLTMPLQKLCGKDCQPPLITLEDSKPNIDSRWASLEAFKKQLHP